MILDLNSLFPDGLSDETVSAISDLLNELAYRWESRYLHQLRRNYARQADLFDPQQPWRNKPLD